MMKCRAHGLARRLPHERRRHRVVVLLLLVCAGALAGSRAALEAAQTPPAPTSVPPVVYTASVDGIIHPVSAEFMIDAMDRADRAGAALLVFMLRTPGGLVDSTRDIVTRMLAAKAPVVVFVGPSGQRAASAGFILTIAADVAAMAPGTHIGAAHPVAGNGQPMDETESKKAAEDVAAYIRTLATGRHRNVGLAEQAVRESRAFTEEEALAASPPLIDLVAPDLTRVLEALDGRTIRRFDGREVRLHTKGATIVPIEMSQRQHVLSAIAHPTIAFGLLSLGVLCLTIELWSPGAVLPGVVGGVSLLLAAFALRLLPVNYAGLLLIGLGLILLMLEIKVTSYGLLTAGGVVSLVFGAMILIDAPEPELRLSLGFVLPVVIGMAAIAAFLIHLAVGGRRQPPVTGAAALIETRGEVLSAIDVGGVGQVRIGGEIWRATATEALPPGTSVIVAGLDGLTLTVRKA